MKLRLKLIYDRILYGLRLFQISVVAWLNGLFASPNLISLIIWTKNQLYNYKLFISHHIYINLPYHNFNWQQKIYQNIFMNVNTSHKLAAIRDLQKCESD